jgi:uncharacterized protein YraI
MKKLFTITLSLALTISMLSACGGSSESEDTTKADTAKAVSAETNIPDTTETTAPTDTEDTSELRELTEDELEIIFMNAHAESYVDYFDKRESLSGDELIDFELSLVQSEIDEMSKTEKIKAPEDLRERFIDWYPITDDADDASTSTSNNTSTSTSTPETSLFTSVSETVYATSTVNIRSSYSTSSTKLGSLSAGSSIQRIGIGTGSAEGWSQVNYNGITCYIKSSYLSTTISSSSGNTSSSKSQDSSAGDPFVSTVNPDDFYIEIDPNTSGVFGNDFTGDTREVIVSWGD